MNDPHASKATLASSAGHSNDGARHCRVGEAKTKGPVVVRDSVNSHVDEWLRSGPLLNHALKRPPYT